MHDEQVVMEVVRYRGFPFGFYTDAPYGRQNLYMWVFGIDFDLEKKC